MDFKKLIDQNDASDAKRKNRIASESSKMIDELLEFARSIDKDMLMAIGKFGKGGNTIPSSGGPDKYAKRFDNSDSWNKMNILVSQHDDGTPYHVLILNGEHGIDFYNDRIDIVVAAVTFDSKYSLKRIGIDYWVENGGCPDRSNIDWFAGRSLLKITNHRHCGDSRTWLQRCRDAMPQFVQEFGEFLKHRAETTK